MKDDLTYGWITRGDKDATIAQRSPIRYALEVYENGGKKVLAEGTFAAVVAAARLLLDATDEEISALREIHGNPIG